MRFTEDEKETTERLFFGGSSARGIAYELNRHHSTILRYLKAPFHNVVFKKSGRKRIHNEQELELIREAVGKKISASALKKKHNLKGSIRTIQRIMRGERQRQINQNLRPELSPEEEKERLQFCKKYCSFKRWGDTIFAGLKQFHVNSPVADSNVPSDMSSDSLATSKKEKTRSILVWGGVSAYNVFPLMFNVEPARVVDFISEYSSSLEHPTHARVRHETIAAEDGRSINRPELIQKPLDINEQNLKTFQWPPNSPDLNLILRYWEQLEKKIYENDQQYTSVTDLVMALEKAWSSMTPAVVREEVSKYEKRLSSIIDAGGKYVTC